MRDLVQISPCKYRAKLLGQATRKRKRTGERRSLKGNREGKECRRRIEPCRETGEGRYVGSGLKSRSEEILQMLSNGSLATYGALYKTAAVKPKRNESCVEAKLM
jgi:hypothetical protein